MFCHFRFFTKHQLAFTSEMLPKMTAVSKNLLWQVVLINQIMLFTLSTIITKTWRADVLIPFCLPFCPCFFFHTGRRLCQRKQRLHRWPYLGYHQTIMGRRSFNTPCTALAKWTNSPRYCTKERMRMSWSALRSHRGTDRRQGATFQIATTTMQWARIVFDQEKPLSFTYQLPISLVHLSCRNLFLFAPQIHPCPNRTRMRILTIQRQDKVKAKAQAQAKQQ